MSLELKQQIIAQLDQLTDEQQQQLSQQLQTLIDAIIEPTQTSSTNSDDLAQNPNPLPLWERIVARSAALPPEVWEGMPTDGARNHDHYLYGAPKQ